MALPLNLGSGLLSEVVIIGLIALVLFIVMKVGKALLKLIFGIIINSILGVMLLLILDYLFNLGISISAKPLILVPIALFGLPATGTIVLLKMLGITLVAVV